MKSLTVCSRSAAAILIARTSSRGKRTCNGICATFGALGGLLALRAMVAACGVICGASTRAGGRETGLGMGFHLGVLHACMHACFDVRPQSDDFLRGRAFGRQFGRGVTVRHGGGVMDS